MRFILPLICLFFMTCSGEATRIKLVNATSFNLENASLSFGSEPEEIDFLAAGDDTRYMRFDGADDCDRAFMGQLQSFGSIESGFWVCGEPEPIGPGEYSLTIAFEQIVGANGQPENAVFLRLREE